MLISGCAFADIPSIKTFAKLFGSNLFYFIILGHQMDGVFYIRLHMKAKLVYFSYQ